LKIVCS